MTRLVLAALTLLVAIAPASADRGSDAAWSALVEGGYVALIRHGNAPPVGGDPPGFRLDDCKTERNLDDWGRGRRSRSARSSASAGCAWIAWFPRPGAGAATRPG